MSKINMLLRLIIKFHVACFIAFLTSIVMGQGTPQYAFHGPPESSSFERGLHDIYPGNELGIAPREEIMDSAIPGSNIPRQYIDETTHGLAMVINPTFLPKNMKDINWRGLPKFKGNRNMLVAEYSMLNPKAKILIFSMSQDLVITVASDYLFPDEIKDLNQDKILNAASRILKIPLEKLSKIKIESTTTTISNIPICHGAISCDYDLIKSPVNSREWWSYMRFWVIKGKMYFVLSVFDWKNDIIPSSMADPWNF